MRRWGWGWGWVLAALAVVCLLLGACGATTAGTAAGGQHTTAAPQSPAAGEYSALLSAFRGAHFTVFDGGATASQQFLTVSGKKVFVDGQALEIYQYATAGDATKDSHNIDDDACLIHKISGGTTMVSWDQPPHLYKKDRLIVIYVGSDYSIIDVLVTQLGPQFAGS